MHWNISELPISSIYDYNYSLGHHEYQIIQNFMEGIKLAAKDNCNKWLSWLMDILFDIWNWNLIKDSKLLRLWEKRAWNGLIAQDILKKEGDHKKRHGEGMSGRKTLNMAVNMVGFFPTSNHVQQQVVAVVCQALRSLCEHGKQLDEVLLLSTLTSRQAGMGSKWAMSFPRARVINTTTTKSVNTFKG